MKADVDHKRREVSAWTKAKNFVSRVAFCLRYQMLQIFPVRAAAPRRASLSFKGHGRGSKPTAVGQFHGRRADGRGNGWSGQ